MHRAVLLDRPVRRFTPKLVAGLYGWWEADRITGLNDGDPITTVPDLSGNARDMAQATASQKPIYKTAIRNGKPIMRFDGSNDHLTRTTDLPSGGNGAIFVVCSFDNFNAAMALACSSDVSLNNNYTIMRASTGARLQSLQKDGIADTASTVEGTTNMVATTWYVLTWLSDGAAYTFRINGTAIAKQTLAGADNGDWFADTSGRDNFTLGAWVSNTVASMFDGDMAGAAVYDAVTISVPNAKKIERYFGRKYGIVIT